MSPNTAREIAATAWCAPATQMIEMDARLASSMADLLQRECNRREELLSYAWAILANVSGGNWSKQNPSWEHAVVQWRAEYFSLLSDADRIYYLLRQKRTARLRST